MADDGDAVKSSAASADTAKTDAADAKRDAVDAAKTDVAGPTQDGDDTAGGDSSATEGRPSKDVFADDAKGKDASASKDSSSDKDSAKSETTNSDDKPGEVTGTGLDAKTLKLINLGKWTDAAARLETLTAGVKAPTRDRAWLAFAYMFLGRCDDLKKLAAEVADAPASGMEGKSKKGGDFSGFAVPHKIAIKAFDQVCQGKIEDAEKTVLDLPRRFVNDAFCNFALAAIYGKTGKAAIAAEYCKRATTLDPNFGWGFRTLGYLQLRWLNQPDDAEKSFQSALAIEPDQGEVTEMLINDKLAKNDFDGAIEVAQTGIASNKRDGSAYYRLAQIYIQQWRLKEALAELKQAIKAEPGNANYYRSRASIKRHQGDLEGAIADQRMAVDLGKDKPFELIELSAMHVTAGDTEAGIKDLKEALKFDPASKAAHSKLIALLLSQKNWNAVLEEDRRALKENPKSAEIHLHLAETLYTLGNEEDAIAEFTQAANLNQNDATPFLRLGAIYTQKREFPKALKAYTKALDINPKSIEALVAVGYCHAQQDDYLKAEAGFSVALAVQQLFGTQSLSDPKREDIVRSLASLLVVEGRYAEAAAQFSSLYAVTRETATGKTDKYLLEQSNLLSDFSDTSAKNLLDAYEALPPEKQQAYKYTLVQTLLRVNKLDLASKQIESLSDEAKEKDLRWTILRARVARLKSRHDDAKRLINEAIDVISKDKGDQNILLAETLVEKARILIAAGDLQGAAAAATLASEKYEKVYSSYVVLGRVRLKEKKPAMAIEMAKKAIAQNQYYTDAYVLLGDAYMENGDPKNAAENYKKAIAIYPGLLNAHKLLLKSYKALALNDEAKKEEEQIAAMEKLQ